jgi:hypothetical protein
MTSRIALILFALIVGLVCLDLFQGWGGTLATLRTAYVLLDWLMFWR